MPFIKSFSKKLALSATVALSTLSAGTQAQAFEPFLGEVRTFGFNFCPRGWAAADGQLLPISQYSALFALFGTIYGGDGRTTFALPDLRGRFVMHQGTGPGLSPRTIGEKRGVETVTLTTPQIPSHAHDVLVGDESTFRHTGGAAGVAERGYVLP